MARAILAICCGFGILSFVAAALAMAFGFLPERSDGEEPVLILMWIAIASCIGLYDLWLVERSIKLAKIAADLVRDTPNSPKKSVTIEHP